MENLDALKKEILEKAKTANACADEYRRAAKASSEEELLSVIHANLGWCIENKAISHEFFARFTPEVFFKSGIANTGFENTGFVNSGNWNSGDRNSGDRNSGDRNSGYRNSGNWNSGDRNSGDSNSGYRNSGAFCNDNDPVLFLFNKPTAIKVRDWENHRAVQLMWNIDPTIWVPSSMMTQEEKDAYPKHETTEGYLKSISQKEAWSNMWHNLTDDDKKVFTDLPNFDASIFEDITGIKIAQ